MPSSVGVLTIPSAISAMMASQHFTYHFGDSVVSDHEGVVTVPSCTGSRGDNHPVVSSCTMCPYGTRVWSPVHNLLEHGWIYHHEDFKASHTFPLNFLHQLFIPLNWDLRVRRTLIQMVVSPLWPLLFLAPTICKEAFYFAANLCSEPRRNTPTKVDLYLWLL